MARKPSSRVPPCTLLRLQPLQKGSAKRKSLIFANPCQCGTTQAPHLEGEQSLQDLFWPSLLVSERCSATLAFGVRRLALKILLEFVLPETEHGTS